MNLTSIISEINSDNRCVVHPPVGLPLIPTELNLPLDIIEFYKLTGGVRLFLNEDYDVVKVFRTV